MKCARVTIPGGVTAIVCTRGRSRVHRCACGKIASLQCDWKVGKGRTCDVHICTTCGQNVGPDKDLRPAHQRAYKDWLAQRGKIAASTI